MSRKPVFDSILSGLNEALEDAKKETPSLKRHRITVIPLKVYEANDIKKIRASTGLSQKYFASYMGVSIKTVEAWEAGINQPSGSSSRLLHMMELDNNLIEKYPIMKGTGGLRKARISLDRKGKSGGARVCFVDFIFVETIYLITVYGKKEKDNLSKAERNLIKKMIDALKKTLWEVNDE